MTDLMRGLGVALAFALSACAGESPLPRDEDGSPFAVEVVSFTPGEGAGFGQDRMPEVVLGPPRGGTTSQGSVDVLSLGVGGSLVVRMGRPIVDIDGPDFIVFENAFAVAGGAVFAEPGEVAISEDGETFSAFPCEPEAPAPNGCAGYALVHAGGDNDLDPTDPAVAGGDAFDLATIGVAEAHFIRIVDRATNGAAPSAGFDVDAFAVVTPR